MPPTRSKSAPALPTSGEYLPQAVGEVWVNSTHVATASLTDRLENLQWTIVSTVNSSVSKLRYLHIDENPLDLYQQIQAGSPAAYPGEAEVPEGTPATDPTAAAAAATASVTAKGKS